MGIKGFKAMNSKMMCRDQKFAVGKTYTEDNVVMCSQGFHFCENVFDVYNYYPREADTVVCEVEALGEVVKEGDNSATNKIKIIRKLEDKELLESWIKRTNSGDGNSGYFNVAVPVYFFNKPSDTPYTKELENNLRSLNVKPILEWIGTSLMTEKEKNDNPSHKTTEGFLRKTERHDWRYLTPEYKNFIKSLPNFDNDVFMKISNGVSLLDDMVEVVVNGIVKNIKKIDARKLGLIE